MDFRVEGGDLEKRMPGTTVYRHARKSIHTPLFKKTPHMPYLAQQMHATQKKPVSVGTSRPSHQERVDLN